MNVKGKALFTGVCVCVLNKIYLLCAWQEQGLSTVRTLAAEPGHTQLLELPHCSGGT